MGWLTDVAQTTGEDTGCHAWVVTGTPPTHSLFNTSICVDDSPFRKLVQSLARQARPSREGEPDASEKLQAVAPVVLRPRGFTAGTLMDSAFLVSDGVVTSFLGNGRTKWQTQTKAFWSSPALLPALPHDPALAGSAAPILAPIHPILLPMSLRAHGPEDTLLALGQEFGTILTSDGAELATFVMPDAPMGPPALGDLDHDGYTDIVVHCRTQIVGLSVAPRAHRKALSVLMGSLLLLLVASIVFHSTTGPSSSSKGTVSSRLNTIFVTLVFFCASGMLQNNYYDANACLRSEQWFLFRRVQ